jgi:hypothetical protein
MAEDTPNTGPSEEVPTSFGVFYPENDVVAIFANDADAQRARQAVINSGIRAERVHEVEPGYVLERAAREKAEESFGDKVGRALSFIFSDTGRYESEYIEEARKGSHFVLVQDVTEEEANQLSPILAANGSHLARYYGGSTVADLIIGRSSI